MDRLFLIHFSPLELYPPVQNFINMLGNKSSDKLITVLTTSGNYPELGSFTSSASNIEIKRLGKSGFKVSRWAKYYFYLRFYLSSCILLLTKRPTGVLYYETLSSFPAYLYKRYINKKAAILVHYHEYSTPQEYNDGMLLTKVFHWLEKWLYPRLVWLSHTNHSRLQFFLDDIAPIKPGNPRVVPNYPPADWQRERNLKWSWPFRLVYVGALSMDTMYTREIAAWVTAQQGRVTLDIYSYNVTDEAKAYLAAFNGNCIRLKEGIDYYMLPETLHQYQAGLILYKGHSLNYEYNAPNKLFEYLAIGLEVWYPEKLKGIHEYDCKLVSPSVMRFNFDNLTAFTIDDIVTEVQPERRKINFTCEAAQYLMAKTYLG